MDMTFEPTEQMTDSSEKCICQLSFELESTKSYYLKGTVTQSLVPS